MTKADIDVVRSDLDSSMNDLLSGSIALSTVCEEILDCTRHDEDFYRVSADQQVTITWLASQMKDAIELHVRIWERLEELTRKSEGAADEKDL